MAHGGLHDRVLGNQQAGSIFFFAADVRPPRVYSRICKPMRRVFASATQSPSRSAPTLPSVERKEQGGGPGRVFLSSTRAAAGQLWGVLKFFKAEEEAAMSSDTDGNVLGDATKRAAQVNTMFVMN